MATQGQLVWVVECKLSLSLELIAQAMEWVHRANFISIAIPKQKGRYPTKGRWAAKRIMAHYGIGMFEVLRNTNNEFKDIYRKDVSPRFNRKADIKFIKDSLCDQQKYWAPAGSQSGRFTPFKQTCTGIERIVKRFPGIVLKDLIDKLTDHHYASDASARASISHWARRGVIKGVKCEKDGKFLRFYPENDTRPIP